jgi:hypothetical protein
MAASKISVHAPVDVVWHVISDFGAADRYLPGVIACSVEGSGVGALRTLTHADGSQTVERLEEWDGGTYTLSYTQLSGTPFHNLLTKISVGEIASDHCEVTFWATLQPDGEPTGDQLETLAESLESNARGLLRLLHSSAQGS